MELFHITRMALVPAAWAMAACSTPVIQSSLADAQPGQMGLVYALPKAQVQLVAQRKQVDASELAAARKEVAEQAAQETAAKGVLDEAQKQLKTAEAALAAAKADPSIGADARLALERKAGIAKAVATVMDARHKAAKARHEAAQVEAAEAGVALGLCRETATLTLLAHAPDPDARYVVEHASSAWRDDQLTLSITPTGLLNTSTAVSTDQTGAVILNVAQTFAAFRTRSSGLSIQKQTPAAPSGAAQAVCSAYKTTRVFDPTRKDEVGGAIRHLKQVGSEVGLCVDGMGEGTTARAGGPLAGYAYRASRPVRVTVTDKPQTSAATCAYEPGTEAASLVAHVPDASTLFVTPVTATAFTKVSNKHTFKDGMLVEVSLDKPSVALALSSLPVEILKALVSIPASIIKLRVDYESQSATLTETQAKALKAQVDLLNAQKALEDRLNQDSSGP